MCGGVQLLRIYVCLFVCVPVCVSRCFIIRQTELRHVRWCATATDKCVFICVCARVCVKVLHNKTNRAETRAVVRNCYGYMCVYVIPHALLLECDKCVGSCCRVVWTCVWTCVCVRVCVCVWVWVCVCVCVCRCGCVCVWRSECRSGQFGSACY